MACRLRRGLHLALLAALLGGRAATADDPGLALRERYRVEVDHRLELPPEAQARYALSLRAALDQAGYPDLRSQYLLLVDRDPQVQAALLWWLSELGEPALIGASPVSTGKPGEYEHFLTPTGVFRHSPANFDHRSEGTENKLGILGYGEQGLRVYDFGWQLATRGWGAGGVSPMRLVMHATDPRYLEPRLGTAQSKGCVRIPTTLDRFLDRYGLLDADYLTEAVPDKLRWLLRPDREPTPWPGRLMVVIDSGLAERPAWSPAPPKTKGGGAEGPATAAAAADRHPACTDTTGRLAPAGEPGQCKPLATTP
ncbi:MAG: murein L,D-transpeptidase [Nevskiaceae bacterium]|nr:MAG: murein L,D-transpeptidase [Nevskiaceae bacterium]